MQCRDIKLQIEAWWDRDLPPETAARVERHLETCPDCRAEYGPVTQLLRHPEPVAVPDGLRDRILAAVEPLPLPVAGKSDNRRHPRPWIGFLHAPWAGALAACLTFAFLAWVSSMIPVGGSHIEEPVVTNPPSPLVLASWAGALTMPGQMGALPAIARAAVFEQVVQERAAPPETFVRNRISDQDLPSLDATPAIPQIPILLRLSALGA
ncbi:MAG TPA: zf-HC2 domain-containing protein [Phycisphaerae bacterium]|jgi:anti-sigma factor RsiW|nr:hypothetical protein [Phycisphaerae bacterium]HOB73347.1 zf-HC2 domain-containing protein [Phycisphaerae bacterium]HOJ55218.1 zf-HC2 domain-containing protein [Phycisphaerae bacterium]HOL24989.1 zf-HC2 domain-containing protein [Phycisphaerae bacterium]HPP20091.1 zf-HC2 domain-containing protein [Phycisphaerae bacterium]